jgi:dephospho-CoA kinase
MLKIGITGGIGSGKTTVCKVFETLGIPVFYADAKAKQLMTSDEVLIKGIKNVFGSESYTSPGVLDRKYLANLVFNDAVSLQKLNDLVHPAVFRAFDRWVQNVPQNTPYILKEAALLFESGSYQACDKNIVVIAPMQLKLDRVIHRDQVTDKEVLARMDKQFNDEQKIKMADYSLENTEQHSLILQVLDLHQQFLVLK